MATVVHVPIPSDAAAREALLDRARVLTELEHPRLEPVLGIDVGTDDAFVVRRGGGAAADLPAVLAVRARLTPPEVCGLLVGLAQGLAALHSAGLAHGDVVAQDVLLDAEGMALLRPRIEAPPGTAGAGRGRLASSVAAQDVHALAVFAAGLLDVEHRGEDAALALQAVLAPALAPDPLVRPEAGTLAAQADAAVAPEPVRLPERARLAAAALGARSSARSSAGTSAGASAGSGSGAKAGPSGAVRDRPSRPGVDASSRSRRRVVGAPGRAPRQVPARGDRRRRRRGVRVRLVSTAAGVALVAAAVAVVIEVQSAGTGPSTTPVAGTSAEPSSGAAGAAAPLTQDDADPAQAAAQLTRRRLELLTGSPGSVAEIDVPGSDAHVADAALLTTLAESGTEVEGAEVAVHDARTVQDDGQEARVEVDYEIGEHVQVDADGTTTRVAATGTRTAELRLEHTEAGWRVASVG